MPTPAAPFRISLKCDGLELCTRTPAEPTLYGLLSVSCGNAAMNTPHGTPSTTPDRPTDAPEQIAVSDVVADDTPISDPEQNAASTPMDDGAPADTPRRDPKKRKDERPTITLKHPAFTAEFRALVNKAAERCGQTQADWIADTLRREAQRVLKGNPPDAPEDAPKLPALPTERLDEQDRRIAALAEQLREMRQLMEQAPQRGAQSGLLARIFRRAG